MKKSMKTVLAVLVAGGWLLPQVASANLLENGSFENPSTASWHVYGSIPGWQSEDGVEIQHEGLFSGSTAADGLQWIELDSYSSDGNDWIYQAVDTVVGQSYTVTFAYSPRPGVTNNDFAFAIGSYDGNNQSFVIDQVDFFPASISGPTEWTYYSYDFTADYSTIFIGFRDIGPDNSIGALIDDVSMEQSGNNPVPEPATMLLLGAGLASLAGTRLRGGRKKEA